MKAFNEEATLKRIRDASLRNITRLVACPEDVFLISNHEIGKRNFDRLTQAMLDSLPGLEKESFTLSLSTRSRNLITRKAEILRGSHQI